MDSAPAPGFNNPTPSVTRSEGVTAAERYLGDLCERSFLSLWSYPRVYKDQRLPNGKAIGKELCDLLVVFDNHIIIFSDKHCRFSDSEDLIRAWKRWYKNTIADSARQV